MIKKAIQMIGNMGWRYIIFRSLFELKKRSGIFKKNFPVQPKSQTYYTLASWRDNNIPFFFESRESLTFDLRLSEQLETDYINISAFKYPFFSSMEFELGANYDWITNPDSKFKYDSELHWLDINDYDNKAGDIKFVWEPSRFSHLYTLIRYDKHSGHDCSERVFSEIERWIDGNKINQGPNFKCSQEISLRVMNWTFALHYYRNSSNLTEQLFNKIQHYIYWQIDHVYRNINFSRIAVRNNHAITETLLLYLAGLLYPDFPNAKKWKKDGKRWFEQEIAYQVYEDGTFLQFSMNYHRVVVQLLTWALRLSELHSERFQEVVYDRARNSLRLLVSCMNASTGWSPNYGNNDGALFFKLSDAHYRDYRPQLEALSKALGVDWKYGSSEDKFWYGLDHKVGSQTTMKVESGVSKFENGGYYLLRSAQSLSFIRCGNHKDRPAQADNLHLDLWYKDMNILHDGGTYKYNSSAEDLKYFMGTASHNTVMLDNYDQMEKGSRFIWYYWTQCENVDIHETEEFYSFCGTIKAFQHIDPSIRHQRKVKIYKDGMKWEVEDVILNKPAALLLNQNWHTSYRDLLSISSSADNKEVLPLISNGYYSTFYGKKEVCDQLTFSTIHNSITTIFTIK
jgi:hypothetical protein